MKKMNLRNAFSLLRYDSLCMRQIALSYMDSIKDLPEEPTDGDAVGNQTFLFVLLTLDLAAIVYEGLYLARQYKLMDDQTVKEDPEGFYERIGRLNEGLKKWDASKRAPIIARKKEEY